MKRRQANSGHRTTGPSNRLVSAAGGLFVAASMMALVASAEDVASQATLAASGSLSWAPPAGWENYTEVNVPAGGGTVTLPSNSRDYRLVANQVITGSVTIRGGRNIVWMGGHIRINRNDTANGAVISPVRRRGLLIDDGTASGVVSGRVVFIEGLRIDGNDLSEGIDTKARAADIFLQNVGIDTVRHRGFDDRDSTGAYSTFLPTRNHPDVIQLFGGYKSLHIDGLSARTNYQGLFLSTDAVSGAGGDIHLRRVDLAAVELADDVSPFRHAGHRGLTWYGNEVGQMFVDQGTVWFRHHANSGWGASGGFKRVAYLDSGGTVRTEPVSGSSQFVDNFGAGPTYPTTATSGAYEATVGSDATGTFATWSSAATLSDGRPAFRDRTGAAAGRVYSGSPPGGSYVPLDTVGLGYVSPGYGSSSPTTSPSPTTTTTTTITTTTTAPPATTTTTAPSATTTTTTAPPATTTTSTSPSGGSVIAASDDSWVDLFDPDDNRGDDDELRVDLAAGRSAYLKFDLGRLSSSEVGRARLRLLVDRASIQPAAVYAVDDSSWQEASITYGNRPALAGLLSLFGVGQKGFVEVDVTPQVRARAGGPLSLALVSTGGDTIRFSSKEGDAAPQLVITP